jgi:hypothetical protein
MRVSFSLLSLPLLASLSLTLATPISNPKSSLSPRDDRGSYIVPRLGARKQTVLGAGGNDLDIAIAMLETENVGTDYAYGDNTVVDSANFGIFKQNWDVMRVCGVRYGFARQPPEAWNNGASMKYGIPLRGFSSVV